MPYYNKIARRALEAYNEVISDYVYGSTIEEIEAIVTGYENELTWDHTDVDIVNRIWVKCHDEIEDESNKLQEWHDIVNEIGRLAADRGVQLEGMG